MQEYRKAESRLQKALESSPNDERLLFNLALVLHERGEKEQAFTVMERLSQSNPKNSDALNYVAYALAERGVELDRAQSVIMQALAVRSNDGFYLDTLGFIYLKQGKLKDAEEALSRAVALTGQDPVIIEHYVQSLLEQGKRQEAAAVLKSAVEQVLSEEDARDKDKKDAHERLKRQLRDLLEKHPELQAVQKSSHAPRALQRRAEMYDAELLKEFHTNDGAS
jgi:Flp pilus assembly protein TadD